MKLDAAQRAKIESKYIDLLGKFRSHVKLKFGDADKVALVQLLDEIGKADGLYAKHMNAAKRINVENIERKQRAVGTLEYILGSQSTS